MRALGKDAAPSQDARRVRDRPADWYYDPNKTAVLIQDMSKEFPARLKPDDEGTAAANARPQTACDMIGGFFRQMAMTIADVFYLTDMCNAYGGTKRAVDGFSLGVQYGESLALLGPNGAGKSTIMNCLSGHTVLTGGKAFVGGFNCQTDIHRVQRALGLCPQFDVVWDTLTVKEHLQLFARLKGVPERRIVAEVQQVAE